MRLYTFLFTLLLLSVYSCKSSKGRISQVAETVVLAKNYKIKFVGRVDSTNQFVQIYWPGTAIKFNFWGTEASINLKDQKGENYLNIIVDNQPPKVLKLDSLRHWYRLTEGLKKGMHSVAIYKRSEWDHGHTDIYSVKVKGEISIPTTIHSRVIEFFGNSITTGYANQDFSGNDQADGLKTNNYSAYAAVTARALDADMICTAKAGIGILISWFPLTMPEMYNRLDPNDPNSHWDFGLLTPDIVVINLFQNDSWLVEKPDFVEFKSKFGNQKPTEQQIIEAYKHFLKDVRKVYPSTPILCTLGSMDATKEGSNWPNYIRQAVDQMQDSQISVLFFPYKGTPGHPHPDDNQKMADLLTQKIKSLLNW